MAILDDELLEEHGGDVLGALSERRKEARLYRDLTGSLPPWWEFGVSLGVPESQKRRGIPGRFSSPQQLEEAVIAYFLLCAENQVVPSPNGLYAALGFVHSWHFHNFVKRNPEFRPIHAKAMTWLKIPLEMALIEAGANVSGAWKRLTNIPDGWELDDDTTVVPLRYEYKDRRQQEVVGLDMTALDVTLNDKSAAELFREMQAAGRKLVEERGKKEQGGGK